jgi:predicted nuclease of predicted toxin-antitoxin system
MNETPWLLGYDAVSVFDKARGIDDEEVLAPAFRERRVLISNDKNFGDRVFREAREQDCSHRASVQVSR